jgi:hypothetical protein
MSMNEWKEYLADGERFLKTAVNGHRNRPTIFTPEIVYNLVGMAVEKHIMGFLMRDGRLADNHTLTDLVRALEEICEVEPDLYDRVIRMDRFQEICSMDAYHRQPPQHGDVPEFLEIGDRIRALVEARLAADAPRN